MLFNDVKTLGLNLASAYEREIVCIKCVNIQQMHYNFKMYLYLYIQQHASASNPAICRVMFLIQEYNCS